MLKSLDVLLRIKQHELDEKRRSLVNLLNEIANLQENDKNLESEMVSEQILAKSTPDSAGMYYGSYVTRVINVRKDIANKILNLEENVFAAQEDIRIAYKDLKVIEITSEKIQKELEAEKEKSEQSVLDEMGQENYRRLKIYDSI